MDFLREEVENLKKLGQSWEMEKYEIEEAIMKAIADKNGNVPDTPGEERTAKRKICHNFFVIFGIITLAFVVVTCGGAILYNNYMPFEVYVNKVVGDLTYPVLRMWRLIVLPLHTYFDIQSYSMAECLINNPWFIPDEPDCSSCENASDIPKVKNVTDFTNMYSSLGNPVIVTDVQPYKDNEVTLEGFYVYYMDNKDNFDTDLCEVSSVDDTVDTIEDYFKLLEKLGTEAPNIRWKVCYGKGLRALRKLLPRPYFVETEGALEKYLMIINSNEEVLPLPTGQYGNSWIAQVTGASDMEINPVQECSEKCPTFNVTLNKGEVMYLNQDFWDVDIVGNPSHEEGLLLLSTFA